MSPPYIHTIVKLRHKKPCVVCAKCCHCLLFLIDHLVYITRLRYLINIAISLVDVFQINVRKQSCYTIRQRLQMFIANMTDPPPFNNVFIPVKLQRSPLQHSMQPYLHLLSNLSHILLIHVSHRDSQLTPYIPVLHSENFKVNTSMYSYS